MIGYVTCAACGVRVRADRPRCPRCEEPLRDAAAAPAFGWLRLSKGQQLAAGVAASFLVLAAGAALWHSKQPGHGTGAPVAVATPAARVATTKTAPAPVTGDPVTVADEVRLARVSFSDGDLLTAKSRYERALRKNPNDPEALNGLGLVLEREGDVAEAHVRFARAAELAPNEWSYRFNVAHAAAMLRQWDEAIVEYRAAAQLFPADYATAFNLAMALHKKGDDRAAIPEFRRAVELAPGDPTFHLALAISLEKIGEIPDASVEYRTYLEMAPSAADAPQVKDHLEALAASPSTPPAPLTTTPES